MSSEKNKTKPVRKLAHKPLVKARELAGILSVSPWTIYSWTNKGVIPAIRMTDRIIRFDPDAVIAALNGRHFDIQKEIDDVK